MGGDGDKYAILARMLRRFGLCAVCLLFVACGPSGTSLYNASGTRVGSVSVENAERAIVYDRDGSRVGDVRGMDVFDRNGSRRGRVTSDDRILNRDGTRVGRIDVKRCRDKNDVTRGELTSDIDDEAAGGGCLLLVL